MHCWTRLSSESMQQEIFPEFHIKLYNACSKYPRCFVEIHEGQNYWNGQSVLGLCRAGRRCLLTYQRKSEARATTAFCSDGLSCRQQDSGPFYRLLRYPCKLLPLEAGIYRFFGDQRGCIALLHQWEQHHSTLKQQ